MTHSNDELHIANSYWPSLDLIFRTFYILLVQQVASEQPLRINISTNSTYLRECTEIRWQFKRYLTVNFETIFYIKITNGRNMSLQNFDGRTSLELEDQPSLLLANTTLSDSGRYRCIIKTYYLSTTFDVDVTIAGKVHGWL